MDSEQVVAELSSRFESLPDDVRADFVDLNQGSFRLTIVPGYRVSTVFGRPVGCAHPYVLSASGFAETNRGGTVRIKIADLLHCVQSFSPMPGGLNDPVKTGSNSVFPGRTVAVSPPVTVVTSSGNGPALFMVTPSGFVPSDPQPGIITTGWRGNVEGPSTQEVQIASFQADGSTFPRAGFTWNLTLEVAFEFNIGG
jgi:hypothetical protein